MTDPGGGFSISDAGIIFQFRINTPHEVGVEIGSLVVHSTYAYLEGTKGTMATLLSDLKRMTAEAVQV